MWCVAFLSWQKTSFFHLKYCWISTRCLRVPHLTVRDKVNKLVMAVVDIYREKGNYLGSKIVLNDFKSLLFLTYLSV